MKSFAHTLIFAASLAAHTALADDAASRETARALYAEATKLAADGKHREALAKFDGAYAATPTPIIGLGWAKSHEALGELVEARERALVASRLPLQKAETQRSALAREQLTKMIDVLAAQVPRVTLLLGSAETQLTVSIDGMPLPKALWGQALIRNPGSYELLVMCGAERVRSSAIELKPTEHREIDLTLLAAACTKKPAARKHARLYSEGFIAGGAVSWVPYFALPPGEIPTSAKYSATAGLTLELGYAISPSFLLLLRGLITVGPQGNPTYLVSAGPTLLFHVADPLWLSASFHGGRAQTELTAYPGKYTSDYVFSSQLGAEIPIAERDYGYWYFGAGAGFLFANLIAKDTPFVYFPVTLGLRSF